LHQDANDIKKLFHLIVERLGILGLFLDQSIAEVLEVDGVRHDSVLVDQTFTCDGNHHVVDLLHWVFLYNKS
jgi:hypothetical protein